MNELMNLHIQLCAPFEDWEVRERAIGGGKVAPYVTAETIENRLDEVLGWHGWDVEYYAVADGTVLCKLTICLTDGRKVVKQGIGGHIQTSDETRLKDPANLAAFRRESAQTKAFKRAAKSLGIGRNLKRSGVPRYARVAYGEVPAEPEPEPIAEPKLDPKPKPRMFPSTPIPGEDDPETESRAFYDWLKLAGERHGISLLSMMNHWGKHRGYPSRMKDWLPGQVADGRDEADRVLAKLDHQFAPAL